MDFLAHAITKIVSALLLPFGKGQSTTGLAGVSVLAGLAMVWVFKLTSNQGKIRWAKDLFKAHVLEIRLYQHELVLIIRALAGALKANLFYLSYTLRPLLVLILPVALLFMQLDERYARRPLSPGEETIVKVVLAEGLDPFSTQVRLQLPAGLRLAAGPVRIRDTREVDWRVEVERPGRYALEVSAAGARYRLPLQATSNATMVGHERKASSILEPFLHPGLPPLPRSSPFTRISLHYPSMRYGLLFWRTHWLVLFLFYSLLGALALKFALKIEI